MRLSQVLGLSVLRSINNKLQQPEEAFGVLEYARKHHRADLVCTWHTFMCKLISLSKDCRL